jgi:hypothetical protein
MAFFRFWNQRDAARGTRRAVQAVGFMDDMGRKANERTAAGQRRIDICLVCRVSYAGQFAEIMRTMIRTGRTGQQIQLEIFFLSCIMTEFILVGNSTRQPKTMYRRCTKPP